MQLSCNKFASNVVETVVRVCGGVSVVRRVLVDELVMQPAAVAAAASDCYGNFVLQSLIKTAGLAELGLLSRALTPALSSSPFATNMSAKVAARRRELLSGAAGDAGGAAVADGAQPGSGSSSSGGGSVRYRHCPYRMDTAMEVVRVPKAVRAPAAKLPPQHFG